MHICNIKKSKADKVVDKVAIILYCLHSEIKIKRDVRNRFIDDTFCTFLEKNLHLKIALTFILLYI